MDEKEFITFAESVTKARDIGRNNGKSRTFFSSICSGYDDGMRGETAVISWTRSDAIKDGYEIGHELSKRLK